VTDTELVTTYLSVEVSVMNFMDYCWNGNWMAWKHYRNWGVRTTV